MVAFCRLSWRLSNFASDALLGAGVFKNHLSMSREASAHHHHCAMRIDTQCGYVKFLRFAPERHVKTRADS